MTSPREDPSDAVGLRWALIRDLLVFVSKAALEAIRDVALIPAAVVAGVAGLLLSRKRPDRYFQRVLRVGDAFDDYVDLFGKGPRAKRRPGWLGRAAKPGARVDDLFDRVERLVVDEYRRGGLTAHAKEAIDRSLDAVQQALGSSAPPPGDRALEEPGPPRAKRRDGP
jgi:hypothetical protein